MKIVNAVFYRENTKNRTHGNTGREFNRGKLLLVFKFARSCVFFQCNTLYSLSLGRADRFYPQTFELLKMGSCPVVRFCRLAKIGGFSLHISKIEGTTSCRLLLMSLGLTAVLDIGDVPQKCM